MTNKNGTNEILREYNSDGNLVYEFCRYDNGFTYERSYDDQGNELRYRNSNEFYAINDVYITKEQYDNTK
jgi:hypothetical protein